MDRSRRVWLVVCILFSCWILTRILDVGETFNENDKQVISNFIEWFGALFGIIIALVLVQVWSKHSQINEELDKEADALTLLLKTCQILSDHTFLEQISTRIKTYAGQTQQAGIRDTKESEASKTLDELHRDIRRIVLDPSIPAPVVSELLRLINEAIDTRGDRLMHIKDRIPAPLWYLIFVTSMVWLFAFFVLEITTDWLAIFLTGGAFFTVSALLFVIKDIDGHGGGVWRAEFEFFDIPIKEAEKLLDEIKQQDAAIAELVKKGPARKSTSARAKKSAS